MATRVDVWRCKVRAEEAALELALANEKQSRALYGDETTDAELERRGAALERARVWLDMALDSARREGTL